MRVAPLGMIALQVTPYLAMRIGRRPREPDDAGLGRGVVRLAGRAQRRHRRHADDAAALLLAHVDGGGADGVERALEVDGDDGVPLGLGHVEDHAVAQDAGHVAPGCRSGPTPSTTCSTMAVRLREVGHRAVVGLRRCRRPSGSRPPPDRPGRFSPPSPSSVAPRSLTTTLAPGRRQRDRDAPADSPSRAGHQRGLAVQHAHGSAPPVSTYAYRPAVSGSGR